MYLRILILSVLFVSLDALFFGGGGGGGGGCGCCQQQQSCCQPQPCCQQQSYENCTLARFFCGYGHRKKSKQGQNDNCSSCCGGCGGGGGGLFGRKKREIGEVNHVRGHIQGVEADGVAGQCNSMEISELIKRNMNQTSSAAAKSAIYQELDALYPEDSFTVLCVDGAVSYQADSHKYCVEGNKHHNCYVFLT